MPLALPYGFLQIEKGLREISAGYSCDCEPLGNNNYAHVTSSCRMPWKNGRFGASRSHTMG